jgi:glycosyltransferase 2 family protein
MHFFNRSFVLYTLKLGITGIIVYLLSRNVDFLMLMTYFHKISYTTAGLALLSFWLGLFMCAIRWRYLIDTSNHIELPLLELVRQVFISFSLSQALPSSIGGDIYRILTLKKYHLETDQALSIVLLDRFYGLVGFVCLSIGAIPLYFNLLWSGVIGKMILFITLGLSVGILCLLVLHLLNLQIINRIKIAKTIIHDFYRSVTDKKFFQLFLTTVCGSFLIVLPSYILGKDLDIHLSISQIMLVLPLVFLSGVLPISFAGWGLREGSMVVLLAVFGVASEGALALAVTIGLLSLIGAIPGIFMWLFIKRQDKLSGTVTTL